MDVDPIFLMAWVRELETEVERQKRILGCVGDETVRYRMQQRLDTAQARVSTLYDLIYHDMRGLAA